MPLRFGTKLLHPQSYDQEFVDNVGRIDLFVKRADTVKKAAKMISVGDGRDKRWHNAAAYLNIYAGECFESETKQNLAQMSVAVEQVSTKWVSTSQQLNQKFTLQLEAFLDTKVGVFFEQVKQLENIRKERQKAMSSQKLVQAKALEENFNLYRGLVDQSMAKVFAEMQSFKPMIDAWLVEENAFNAFVVEKLGSGLPAQPLGSYNRLAPIKTEKLQPSSPDRARSPLVPEQKSKPPLVQAKSPGVPMARSILTRSKMGAPPPPPPPPPPYNPLASPVRVPPLPTLTPPRPTELPPYAQTNPSATGLNVVQPVGSSPNVNRRKSQMLAPTGYTVSPGARVNPNMMPPPVNGVPGVTVVPSGPNVNRTCQMMPRPPAATPPPPPIPPPVGGVPLLPQPGIRRRSQMMPVSMPPPPPIPPVNGVPAIPSPGVNKMRSQMMPPPPGYTPPPPPPNGIPAISPKGADGMKPKVSPLGMAPVPNRMKSQMMPLSPAFTPPPPPIPPPVNGVPAIPLPSGNGMKSRMAPPPPALTPPTPPTPPPFNTAMTCPAVNRMKSQMVPPPSDTNGTESSKKKKKDPLASDTPQDLYLKAPAPPANRKKDPLASDPSKNGSEVDVNMK